MDLTRKLYHQSVPLLSLSLAGCLLPSHIAGTATNTGTKMMTRCKKRRPVAIGSIMYRSTKKYSERRYLLEFCIAFGTCSFSSLLDTSSMASSCVLPLSVSSWLISTNASGLRIAAPAPDQRIVLPGKRGVAKCVRMNEERPDAKGRVDGRSTKAEDWRKCWRRHWRPSQKAVLIVEMQMNWRAACS